jgi:hypothetical protein
VPHLVAAADGWDDLNEEDRELVNRALALFDVLGFYVAKRYVKFDDARDLWGPTVTLAWTGRRRSFKAAVPRSSAACGATSNASQRMHAGMEVAKVE